MDQLDPAVDILTAMITPAVIISACGTLIVSTTTRAARVNDRLHKWIDDFVALMQEESDDPLRAEHRAMVFHQIDRLTSRARLLQLSLMAFYISLALFVATSFAIGVFTAADSFGYIWRWDGWVAVTIALFGGGGLLAGCILLISEARLALAANNEEMDFIWQLGKRHATDELLEELRAGRQPFVRLPGIPGMTGRNRKA
jgi:hypothetical protein